MKISGLEAAQAVREAKLSGQSPRARGEEKTRLALDWIYRWGWASPSIVDRLSGAVRRGLAARLVRQGLLVATRTESAGAVRGVPAKILTLSESGQAEVERWRSSLIPYSRDPYRIRQDLLRHNQLAQQVTATSLLNGSIRAFLTEQEIANRSEVAQKQPDVVWVHASGKRCAVEVELTAKWGRQFDQFVSSCLLALAGTNARYDLIAIISDSPAILRRYAAAFEPGYRYRTWERDARGHWQSVGTREVPAWARERVLCKRVD